MTEQVKETTVSNPVEAVVMLPCPFCGGKAKLYGGAYSQETYDAACTKCRASTSGTMDRQESIDRWNKRAS